MNLVEGRLRNGGEGPVFTAGELTLSLASYHFADWPGDERPAVLGVRPEHIAMNGAGPWANFRTELVEPHGADNLVWCTDGTVSLQLRLPGDCFPSTGAPLTLSPDASRIALFDKATGDRL
jgi:multiple sugar transport system ATP-binding protein